MEPGSQENKWKRCDESHVDSIVDRARQGVHCSLFCGGEKCRHEDYLKHLHHPNVHPALDGLNSHFVGDLVVASQRPSTSLFIKHMLVEQFRSKAITGVFNLQEKGEHASCGPDGIYAETGYSYSGENDLMRFGIAYYEFPWPDMTAPENDIVLRSVQCMDHHVKARGRVLVHCHAGLGRTGLMIACYFILAHRMSASDAISLVRTSRPGAIQTKRQVQFCLRFEGFVQRLGYTFKEMPSDGAVTFSDFLQRQFQFLHGDEAKVLKYLPRHVFSILRRIVDITQSSPARARALALASFAPSLCPDLDRVEACQKHMNRGSFSADAIDDVPLLCHLVLEWFRRLDEPFLTLSEANLFVETMRSRPSELASVVGELPRAKRHTAGYVISAIYCLGKGLPQAHVDRALLFVCDAFIQQLPGSPEDQSQHLCRSDKQMLHHALILWANDIADGYFRPASVPANRRVVRMIAEFEQKPL